MKKKEKLNKWLKTNVNLHNALEELKVLDAEREKIKEEYEKSQTISKELESKMKKNIKDYEELLKKIKELKNKEEKN